jgi:predicted Fe-Mo cluster-binding NifX family protein/ferredoxin
MSETAAEAAGEAPARPSAAFFFEYFSQRMAQAMKIAISATHGSLDAQVDPRFGRCPYFLIVETDRLSYEALENPNAGLGGGAGIQSAQLVAQRGVRHVLTGNCGPNAYHTLSAAGIAVVAGCSGPVREVIARFTAGGCIPVAEATVPNHYGVKNSPPDATFDNGSAAAFAMGRGAGRGMGGRRGMGGGRGRGMMSGMGQGPSGGRGMRDGGVGRGMGSGSFPTPQSASRNRQADESELAKLNRQSSALNQQLQHIQGRINRMNQGTKVIAKIDIDLCSGCGTCVEACPREAIQVVEGVAQVKEEDCIGCGACAAECPLDAIRIA